MIHRLTLLIFVLFISTAGYAADSITYEMGTVTDSRTSGGFWANLEVELKIKGETLPQFRGIRKFSITKAMDSTGKNLLKPASTSSTPSPYQFEKLDGQSKEINRKLELLNPARKAKVIPEITGVVEFHAPSRDPKSKSVVKAFMKQSGKPLKVDALKKAKVELTVMTKAQFEEVKKAEEAKRAKTNSPVEELAGAISSMTEGLFGLSDTDLLFMIKDPSNKLVDLEVLDAAGKPIQTTSRSASTGQYTISFQELPPQDAQLVLYMETSKSVVKTPFRLAQIALP